jgi:hypothetical protein
VEFEKELAALDNRLRTTLPADVELAEITIKDFENIMAFWDPATPEERAGLLGRIAEKLYVDFATGQLLELVPKAASVTCWKPLSSSGRRALWS